MAGAFEADGPPVDCHSASSQSNAAERPNQHCPQLRRQIEYHGPLLTAESTTLSPPTAGAESIPHFPRSRTQGDMGAKPRISCLRTLYGVFATGPLYQYQQRRSHQANRSTGHQANKHPKDLGPPKVAGRLSTATCLRRVALYEYCKNYADVVILLRTLYSVHSANVVCM